jgi:hypothetical protein
MQSPASKSAAPLTQVRQPQRMEIVAMTRVFRTAPPRTSMGARTGTTLNGQPSEPWSQARRTTPSGSEALSTDRASTTPRSSVHNNV